MVAPAQTSSPSAPVRRPDGLLRAAIGVQRARQTGSPMKRLFSRQTAPALMQHSYGRGSREAVIWEALLRIDGKPAVEMDAMQMAMSTESQIRLAEDVIRRYLNGRGLDELAAATRRGAGA